jgi:hypothetical protein
LVDDGRLLIEKLEEYVEIFSNEKANGYVEVAILLSPYKCRREHSTNMSFPLTTAASRLTQVKDSLTFTKRASEIPWDPDSDAFPTRKELPRIDGAPKGAAWVWGEDDNVGRDGQRDEVLGLTYRVAWQNQSAHASKDESCVG